MDDAELVGGALLSSPDPRKAANTLSDLLKTGAVEAQRIKQLGFDPELVTVLRRRFAGDVARIDRVCGEGAAWVLGRGSQTLVGAWELVASLPAGVALPRGLHRTTGETMLGLVSSARRSIRVAAPFVDESALVFLADALIAATMRSVRVEMLLPRSPRAVEALSGLNRRVGAEGLPKRFRVASLRADAPWAHLKVVTADSSAAYIGSANVTAAALSGPNLELGVLVRGPGVRTVEEILDLFRL